MQVILLERVAKLGQMGEVVDVKPGYARNYLLPQQKAVPATPQNRRMLAQEKAKFDLQIAKEKKIAEESKRKVEEQFPDKKWLQPFIAIQLWSLAVSIVNPADGLFRKLRASQTQYGCHTGIYE